MNLVANIELTSRLRKRMCCARPSNGVDRLHPRAFETGASRPYDLHAAQSYDDRIVSFKNNEIKISKGIVGDRPVRSKAAGFGEE